MNINASRRISLIATLALTCPALAATALAASPAQAAAPRVTATVFDRTLYVVGTQGADSIGLAPDAEAARLVVDAGGDGVQPSFASATFDRVVVSLRGGDDQLAVTPVATPFPGALTVLAGHGDDVVQGSRGDDLLIGGPGDDRLLGSDGVDVLLGRSGDDFVNGQRGNDTEVLGAGDDLAAWVPGEASDVVQGGPGADRLDFLGANAPERYAVAAEGRTAVLTRDLGAIRMETVDVEALTLETLGGADEVTLGDLSGTRLTSVGLDLGATVGGAADGAVDTVTVTGTDRADRVDVTADGGTVVVRRGYTTLRAAAPDLTDRVLLNTLGGDDDVTVSAAAAALLDVVVDLGPGEH